jgi:uncharacterized protein (TIGR03083 family)
MDIARLAEGLREHTTALAATAAGTDPAARVPTCPEWTLRVLVGHIGQVHRWAAGIVESGPSPIPDPLDADPGVPGEWPDWLRAGADSLATAVLAGPDRPVWTFFGERPASFWLRRMLHDLTVHHADVGLTAGVPVTIAPDLAADGITELLEVMADPVAPTLRPEVGELRGTGQTLRFAADDSWLVTRTPGGLRWELADGPADVTVTGTAEDLLLVLAHRRPVEAVTVRGDRALLDHLLAHGVL